MIKDGNPAFITMRDFHYLKLYLLYSNKLYQKIFYRNRLLFKEKYVRLSLEATGSSENTTRTRGFIF
jgi:hypothetical protein